MKNNKVISIIALLFLCLGAVACTTNNNEVSKELEQADLSGKIVENVDSLNTNPVEEEVVLIIEGNNDRFEDVINIKAENTVYDVLVESSNINKLGLITKDYDFGKSIDGIGDDTAGTDNKFWIYYINGKMAMQSVDNQEVKGGDRIEFKFEESTM